MNTQDSQHSKILGVDTEIIKQFLELIEDKYPLVDYANFFLEIKTGTSGINIAMANERDFLSHFCTVLSEKDLTLEKQRDQLSAAEEHLRRAVMESYQKAVEIKLIKVLEHFKKYEKKVIPYQRRYPSLDDAPSLNDIRLKLREIQELRQKGRAAKRQNKWDDNWEDGVTAYVNAFIDLEKLGDKLEDYLALASQLHNAGQKRITIYRIVAVASIIVNIFFIVKYLMH